MIIKNLGINQLNRPRLLAGMPPRPSIIQQLPLPTSKAPAAGVQTSTAFFQAKSDASGVSRLIYYSFFHNEANLQF